MSGLEGRNALVTGGGSGLGLACAKRLRADGATVTIIGRTEDRLVAAADVLGAVDGPGEVRWQVADVVDEGAVEAAVELADTDGGLSIVVASAGVGWLAPIATVPVEAWRNVMEVNLTGNFLTLKHAAPRMRAAGGAYTAISSVAGAVAGGFLSPYSTAKAGVDMFVRSAADELGPWGIRVNSVQPGLVPTDLAGEMAFEAELRDEHLDNMPIARLGTGDDVAAAASSRARRRRGSRVSTCPWTAVTTCAARRASTDTSAGSTARTGCRPGDGSPSSWVRDLPPPRRWWHASLHRRPRSAAPTALR